MCRCAHASAAPPASLARSRAATLCSPAAASPARQPPTRCPRVPREDRPLPREDRIRTRSAPRSSVRSLTLRPPPCPHEDQTKTARARPLTCQRENHLPPCQRACATLPAAVPMGWSALPSPARAPSPAQHRRARVPLRAPRRQLGRASVSPATR